MEEDLHGPGFDAAGASFPGVNLYVELGHGRDYAWSATTADSDVEDTFAEVLCKDNFHYLYRGKCLPMTRLERKNSWHPNALDQSPPASETLVAHRTVLGTGQYEWKGYDPSFRTARWLPYGRHPHGTDKRFFVNWNNHQARRWNAADDNYHYESVYRQQLLADKVRRHIRGKRKMRIAQ